MIVRKKFTVESAHIVRNCTSHRCSHSIHGHSAEIDVYLEGNQLDNAGMLMDFGLMKGPIKEFIDSFDHCYMLCSKDSDDFRNFIKTSCDRWVEMPFNPSAECLAMMFHVMVQNIINHTNFNNGEGTVKVKAVRYRETETGWAESSREDIESGLWRSEWVQMSFSPGVVNDWSPALREMISEGKIMDNPVVPQQIDLN